MLWQEGHRDRMLSPIVRNVNFGGLVPFGFDQLGDFANGGFSLIGKRCWIWIWIADPTSGGGGTGHDTSEYLLFLTPDSGSATLRYAMTTIGTVAEQSVEAVLLPVAQWRHVAVTRNTDS
jgi:hypothetical protein